MCGIAGIVSRDDQPVSLRELRMMCDAMRHRGPNDEGFHLGRGVGLGMRRLSIIDLQTGHQPVRNEDGSVWVVLNGEIYNFRDLRQELEHRGHVFYTATDTEVIVHLYEEYGERCVEKLRGMFAFALWDERARTLLLARDRLGIKPLYYAELPDGRLAFGSELKVLLQLPEIDRRLDWSAVNHLFTFLTTPAAQSIIEGVRKLEPGCTLRFAPERGVEINSYWDLQFAPDHGRSEAFFIAQLRELLEESVRLHLVSDVPLGAFLSGGIDSSSVAATMARLTPGRVKTFSIGFAEPNYNEAGHAQRVAQMLGTEHRELMLGPDILNELIEDFAWYLDEPFGDSSAIPMWAVSKLAAREVTVVLSGDGGDELFAGYDRYLVEEHERRYRYVPSVVRRWLAAFGERLPEGATGRRFLRHIGLNEPARYLDAVSLFALDQKRQLFQADVYEKLVQENPWRDAAALLARGQGHWLSALQYLDTKRYLPLDILTKVDRMSMAHSIEARVPLLDHRLVEFAATIPPGLKLRHGSGKNIFKQAMRGILPDAIIDRRKQGFAVPLGNWFRQHLSGYVRDLLLSPTSRGRNFFNVDYLERLVSMHEKGRDLDLQLWTLMSFELWCRSFLDGGTRHLTPVPAFIAAPTTRPQFTH